ncbi:hypothetical protein [Rufibacter roseus]|uniref:Uncharacterized protein n=1 Tax=Rufibacter roseus TaxID=1567108 RepID=A0ABW2DQW7_9BACT|nr:hypothetical protein [Rufibacter roseus]
MKKLFTFLLLLPLFTLAAGNSPINKDNIITVTSNVPASIALSHIKSLLEKQGYTIKELNEEAGTLSTEPKQNNFGATAILVSIKKMDWTQINISGSFAKENDTTPASPVEFGNKDCEGAWTEFEDIAKALKGIKVSYSRK